MWHSAAGLMFSSLHFEAGGRDGLPLGRRSPLLSGLTTTAKTLLLRALGILQTIQFISAESH